MAKAAREAAGSARGTPTTTVAAVSSAWANGSRRVSIAGTAVARSRLVSACAAEHGRDRPQQDAQVDPERDRADVLPVVLHPLFEGTVRTAAHLPPTGDPGLYGEPQSVLRAVELNLARQG